MPSWDYKKLGEAFGAAAFAVTTMNELEAALTQVAELTNVPSLVAVRIEPHTLPEALRPAPVAKGMMMSAGDECTAISRVAFN